MNASKILIAEDENIVAMDIQEALRNAQYDVLGMASSGREAVQRACEARPDLVLMDIRLKGDMDGIQAASEIREKYDIPVIYLTAYSDEGTLQRAKLTEPFGYLLKPFEKNDLRSAIEMALYKHRMEKAIKESRQWLAAILRSTGDAIMALDAHGIITFMNPVAESMAGLTSDRAHNHLWTDAIRLKDETGSTPPPNLEKAFQEGRAADFSPQTVLVMKDGTTRPLDGDLTPTLDEKGRLTGFVLAFRDITHRKKLEDELRASNEVLEKRVTERTEKLAQMNRELQAYTKEIESLYNYAPCGYHSLDRRGLVTRINSTELHWLGYKADEVVDKFKFADLLAPPSRPVFLENLAIFEKRGWLRDVEYQMVRKDGSIFPVLLSTSAVKDAEGRYYMGRVNVYDMTERKRAEEALQESESKFRCISESAADGIVVADQNGDIIYTNKSLQTFFGYAPEEITGKKAESLLMERHRQTFRDVWDRLASMDADSTANPIVGLQGLGKNGREFDLEASMAAWSLAGKKYFAAILRDVSERKKLEAGLRHTDKLAAMGQMAAGVAHELKTPLGVIYGFTDVLLQKFGGAAEFDDIVKTLKRQVSRCAGLVDNLLGFSRRHTTPVQEIVYLNDVLTAAVALVNAHAMGKSVSITQDLATRPLPVRGAKDLLEQVMINLSINAIDAMPKGGTLTLRTGRTDRDCVPYARLQVTDTGTGIAPEVLERIFEPFFTTKDPGNGTGLGLWLTKEILTSMEGDIQCESAPGKGTTFTVVVPLADDSKPPANAKASNKAAQNGGKQGNHKNKS